MEWISVEDKLPEVGGFEKNHVLMLVYYGDMSLKEKRFIHQGYYSPNEKGECWWEWCGDSMEEDKDGEITHWMLKPKLPS